MIYPGTDLKFRVTTEMPDFSLSDDRFGIMVKDIYGRTEAVVSKGDCFKDDQGRYYFALEKVRAGWHFAFFTAYREDEDFSDDTATMKDSQPLCCVGYCENHAPRIHDCDEGRHMVHYEQVWTVSVGGNDYLADCHGNYVYTSDGHRIQFTKKQSNDEEDMGKVKMQMTGDEFLQLIEGRNPNGEVDTIPEMIAAMEGIGDDETIKEEISQEVDEEVDENTPERVTPEDLENFQI